MARTPTTQNEIIQILEKNHILTAVEIGEKLRQSNAKVNKTTIYRAIEKLLETGQVCRLSLGSDRILYELRETHHDHAVCENCGKIQSISCSNITPSLPPHFDVKHHHLTIFGFCDHCATLPTQ